MMKNRRRTFPGLVGLCLLAVFTGGAAAPQTPPETDVWEPLRFFVGRWEGVSQGQPGEGTVTREYEFVLKGRFLEGRNQSTYRPQQKNPRGEVHEDWSMFSYDKSRKAFVLRQFHLEGFVNQYVAEGVSPGSKTFSFVSESIENIPPGFRARETYELLNADEFIETFDLAEPGQEFELYSRTRFKRVK
jgi:hypothetical protein